MLGMPRFTLRGLMVFVAAVAYCLGISRVLGLALGTLLVILMLCYVLASLLSVRTRAICAASCSFLALFEWFDQGDAAIVLSNVDDRLPNISLPSALGGPLSAFDFLAEFPLRFLAGCGDQYHEIVFVDFAPFLRPFVVFVFWLGLALAFGLSVGTSLYTRWQGGRLERGQTSPSAS